MKKKLKRAIKEFFKPSEKPDHESLYEMIENLQYRISDMESEHIIMMRELQKIYTLIGKEYPNEN
jgi:hypothetical protein